MRGLALALVLAAPLVPCARAASTEPSLYELGTAARKRGDHKAAKQYFAKMLAQKPSSGGALEGISVACLALEQYDEAVLYLERWDKLKPNSAYIQDLLAQARRGQAEAKAKKAAEPPSLYEIGWAARKRGDHRASKEAFAQLLAQDPGSKGALEGLSLDCLSMGEYAQAVQYLEQWRKLSPGSAYVLGLLARAERGLGDDDAALRANVDLIGADPHDLDARHRVDSVMGEQEPGLFPQGRIRKSLSSEGLGTPSPQRIVYEGRSGALRSRARIRPALNLIGGVEFAEDAQRNDTGGFIYYDVLEHIYSFGLEYKPAKNVFLSGEYGQDVVDNVHGAGLPGRTLFSKAKLVARARLLDTDWSLEASRAPYFNRGAGGNNFFALLRDAGAKLQAEKDVVGMTWRAKAGIDAISEGTTLKTWSLLGTKEYAGFVFQPGYSHSEQDFYGAAPDGRLAYVLTDRYGGRVRRLVEEKYQLAGSGGYTVYADGNRLTDASFEAIGWLPWCKELYGSYRFDSLDFKNDAAGYNSVTQFNQWLGAFWRHDWSHGLWTRIGYEHGFLWDLVRRHYDGSAWLAELEWYRKRDLSFRAQGRVGLDTVHDQSYSAGLQARYSF